MESKDKTPPQYYDVLNSKGRSLQSIGSNEIALCREDLLEALMTLKGKQIAILGGAVLRIVDGEPQYNYDGWHSDFMKDQSFTDYAEKSWRTAWEYVRSYPDSGDSTILYTLTLADEDWLSKNHKT